jgi:hypothetical protein
VSCFYVNRAFNAIISDQKPIKQKTPRASARGVFFFAYSQRLKKSFLTAFVFLRVELYQRERKRATERENQSERGQRQRGKHRKTNVNGIFTASNGFLRLHPINYTPESRNAHNGKF